MSREGTPEEDILKDKSRPFFQRNTGEVGIYIDAYDAKPVDPLAYGSHHFHMMTLVEELCEAWRGWELVDVKTALAGCDIGRSVIPTVFEKGIVLRCVVDTADAVTSLEGAWKDGRLEACLQTFLITPTLLQTLAAKYITIKVKLWEDELEGCREERTRDGRGEAARCPPHDSYTYAMLQRARRHQRELSKAMLQLRDEEYNFDRSLGDFIQAVKHVLGHNFQNTPVTSVQHLRDLAAKAKQKRQTTAPIERCLGSLSQVRETFEDVIEKGVCHSLNMVPREIENAEQRRIKDKMNSSCASTLALLRSGDTLERVQHAEWLPKILPREQGTFRGIVSLLPASLTAALDLDTDLDDYLGHFGVR